jgi:hypothetical protein
LRDLERSNTAPQRALDALFAEFLKAGQSLPAIRETLDRAAPDETVLVALLRRAVPVTLLEHLAAASPWAGQPLVLGAIVRNPRVPRALGLKLLPSLYWHDLAEVAANPWTQGALRIRAEMLLNERLGEMRLGDKIALGRVATPPVLGALLQEKDPKVLEAAVQNPRLRQEDLLRHIRSETASLALFEVVAGSPRWRDQYGVRLAFVLQPRTPLPLALAQVSALVRSDLLRVAEDPGLRPLLQAAALRVAESQR